MGSPPSPNRYMGIFTNKALASALFNQRCGMWTTLCSWLHCGNEDLLKDFHHGHLNSQHAPMHPVHENRSLFQECHLKELLASCFPNPKLNFSYH